METRLALSHFSKSSLASFVPATELHIQTHPDDDMSPSSCSFRKNTHNLEGLFQVLLEPEIQVKHLDP